MPNFDGLWELRGYYTTTPSGFTIMEHRFTMDLKVDGDFTPGTDFADIGLLARNNSDVTLVDWCDDVTAEWVDSYPATASLGRYELWKYEEGSLNGLYISTFEVGTTGDNVNPSAVASQATWTFRSVGGGVARLQFMESSYGDNTKISPPYGAEPASTATLMTAVTSPVLARDNTAIFANIHFSQGQNEKLWKKRYRP